MALVIDSSRRNGIKIESIEMACQSGVAIVNLRF